MSDWSESPNVREEVADAVAWGKKIERERIIALLRDSVSYCSDEHRCEDCEPVKRHIALINGENK